MQGRKTVYVYIPDGCGPLGVGHDYDGDPADFNVARGLFDWCPDSDGVGREPNEPLPPGERRGRVPTAPGTMMFRAFSKLRAAGIGDTLIHTLPPAPNSELGLLLKQWSYPDLPTWWERRIELWNEASPNVLNGGEDQILSCDGAYEPAIRILMRNNRIVCGSPINATCMLLKAKIRNRGGTNPFADHPVLKYVDELYPTHAPDGRSMDIWHPNIVDALFWFYACQGGEETDGRHMIGGTGLKGLWLTLGGPFLWGETCNNSWGPTYHVRTPYAKAALNRDDDIDMARDGRTYAPIITSRLGNIASELVLRLKAIGHKHFYFHTYTIPPNTWRPEYQAMGTIGVARELCERMAAIPDIYPHMIISHAHECSPASATEAHDLQRKYPDIEFIAGTGWGLKLRTSGLARLAEGYQAIEVGLQDRQQWAALPGDMEYLRATWELLKRPGDEFSGPLPVQEPCPC